MVRGFAARYERMHALRWRRAIGLVVLLGWIWIGGASGAQAAGQTAGQAEKSAPAAVEASETPADPAAPVSAAPCPPKKAAARSDKSALRSSIEKALPILILVLVVGFVLARLPKIEGVDHSAAYRRRRAVQ